MSRPADAMSRTLDGLRWARAGIAAAGAAAGQLAADQRHELAADLARIDSELAAIMAGLVAPEAKP